MPMGMLLATPKPESNLAFNEDFVALLKSRREIRKFLLLLLKSHSLSTPRDRREKEEQRED
jgi:hypothetical protein